MNREEIVYPYIPNSVPAAREEMLRATGAKNVAEFYQDVPPDLWLKGPLDLPEPLLSEYALKRHVEALLARNRAAGNELLSFLGAGCYQHHVPAVCDEVNQRSEFLTAYAGEPYDDHGRFQALFEYTSMMGELLEMDVVNVPVYDGFQASATALRMAGRLTGRREALLCGRLSLARLSKMRDYCRPAMELRVVGGPLTPARSGPLGLSPKRRGEGEEPPKRRGEGEHVDLEGLRAALSERTAAVYFENPSYLGFIEGQGREISALAHEAGAVCVVAVNPMSLGVLAPPASYGADIVCGDIQPLGIHMQFGGGHAGFIATHDDPRYVQEYPSRLFGIAPTRVPGEYGFGDVAYERTSFAVREEGKEWVGTAAALWGITAGVYLALMGPRGMAEIGEGIMARARYAMLRLDAIEGVRAPAFEGAHFQEFAVDLNGTGRTVAEINRGLLARGIQGGLDLSAEFPELGQCALCCVTEVHSQADIDRLAAALGEVVA